MNYKDLMKHYQTPAAAGKAIGYDRQRIHPYKDSNIPLAVQVEFEIESEGALKADIPECIRTGRKADYIAEKQRRIRKQLKAVGA